MYEDLSNEVGVFDFEELANHLLEQGLEASPSQLHGCLCGLLAAGAEFQAEVGLDGITQCLDLEFHGELAVRLMQLYTVTGAALEDEEFAFHLLLPDDELEIEQRTHALAEWCAGFLVGFAHVSASAARPAAALTEDSSEILRDIAAIAEATVDDEQSEDDAEESYMELVEYLRFAVLNVFMDCRRMFADDSSATESPQPLH